MNYELLFETFPHLVPYEKNTKNKYVFQSNDQLFEIAKSQITEQEKKMLSIVLKPLNEQFSMENLWCDYFNKRTEVMPEKVKRFQLFKILFSKPLLSINDFRVAFEAIAGTESYLITINETSCFLLFINTESFIEMNPYLSLLQDDFKTNFSLMTTPLEASELLAERVHLMRFITSVNTSFKTDRILELEAILERKMLSHFSEGQSNDYCYLVFKEAIREAHLIETIAMYISYCFNFSQTAKKLYIHRNTLQKRLDRFEQLSNRNLKNSDDIYQIMTALKLIEMYKMHT